MFLIDTVAPEAATGAVAEVYGMFPPHIGIPLSMQLFSASPGLMARQADTLGYYVGHDTLGHALKAAIRYVSARREGYEPCVEFNGGMLCAMGMTPADLEALMHDPASTPLEAREAALVSFVHKVQETPESVERADVDALCALGWSQGDVFDALVHGASLAGPASVFKALWRDEA